MKFPLPNHPFQKVALTAAQCDDFETVTSALLDETLAEYDRFVRLENRTLPKKLWKPVKTRENLTVFKETTRGQPRTLPDEISANAAVSIATNMDDWRLPKLLAVGSIVGTLDDVMYGVVAPDVKSMLLRSSYVNDELVDGGVLFHIKGATSEDPFRFLGVKWLVKAHPTGINAVVAPRDSVVIDATGLHTLPSGERIGYHTFHSVLLPECPELTHHAILRGSLSSCYLFKQTLNGTVEVYMKTFVEAAGKLIESLAVTSVANALVGCYKSVLCAQGKKLTWLIKRNAAQRQKERRGTLRTSNDANKDHCCELCQAQFRSYKVARGCVACLRSVCSRCHTSRKISHMQRGLQVKQTSVVVCTECTNEAGQLSTLDVACDEFVGRAVHQQSLMTDQCDLYSSSDSESESCWAMSSTRLLSDEMMMGLRSVSPTSPSEFYKKGSMDSPDHKRFPRTSSYPSSTSSYSSSTTSNGSLGDVNHREQLLLQMSQLRLAAEKTYIITKQNESAMRFEHVRD